MTDLTKLGQACISLKKRLFGTDQELGFIGIGADEIIVYVHGGKRAWKGKQVFEWEGYPVRWRYNVGPIVAFGT